MAGAVIRILHFLTKAAKPQNIVWFNPTLLKRPFGMSTAQSSKGRFRVTRAGAAERRCGSASFNPEGNVRRSRRDSSPRKTACAVCSQASRAISSPANQAMSFAKCADPGVFLSFLRSYQSSIARGLTLTVGRARPRALIIATR
jgi:hypothetical protein